jgi:hypothetical protein
MRLIKRGDSLFQKTENPEIAASLVSEALRHGDRTILGADHLRISSGPVSDSEIIAAVRRGELLLVRDQFTSFGGSFMGDPAPAPTPEPVYIPPKEQWPHPKPRDDQVFAKSCIPGNWCQTDAGTTTEPASNFGNVMVAGAMLFPSTSTAVATALGADLALGRMAGGGIMQRGLNWVLRGAGGPASVFILGMLPAKMGDGTLYTDDQLRSLGRAPTRVRFQFRRDAEGVLQVYGIHSSASGDDTVPTVPVTWNADKTAMEAKLNGITIIWTPRRGPLGEMPPLIYPDDSGAHMGTILVHPIPDNTDSQI